MLRLVDKKLSIKIARIWFLGWRIWKFSIHVNNKNYAIDYNSNKTIELKNIEDSFASAANYLKTIGWKKSTMFLK